MAKIICKNFLESWIIDNIQVVAQLSEIDAWKNHMQKKEHVNTGREEEKIFWFVLILRVILMS